MECDFSFLDLAVWKDCLALLLYCTPVYCQCLLLFTFCKSKMVNPMASVIPRELMVFRGLFLHLKTLVYFLNLDFERLGPLNRELNVSSRHGMHSWHWPPKRRDSRNSVCVLKEGGLQ